MRADVERLSRFGSRVAPDALAGDEPAVGQETGATCRKPRSSPASPTCCSGS